MVKSCLENNLSMVETVRGKPKCHYPFSTIKPCFLSSVVLFQEMC